MVGTAWAISFLLSFPQMFIFSYKEVSPGQYNCWANFDPEWTLQAYVTWFSCAIYIGPTLILVLVYGRICMVVWQSAKQCINMYVWLHHTVQLQLFDVLGHDAYVWLIDQRSGSLG